MIALGAARPAAAGGRRTAGRPRRSLLLVPDGRARRTGARAIPTPSRSPPRRQTRLAYVQTGIPELDATSRAGLIGLTAILNDRTAVESRRADGRRRRERRAGLLSAALLADLAGPAAAVGPRAVEHVNAYLRNGGIILFDTLDQSSRRRRRRLRRGPGIQRLRDLARSLDIPPLMPVPPDHVLTQVVLPAAGLPRPLGQRRRSGSSAARSSVNDGVSSVIIGGNDWAERLGGRRRPAGRCSPSCPAASTSARCRYRFGVNLVMYALTGNYKSDQVHVPGDPGTAGAIDARAACRSTSRRCCRSECCWR